uniref:serine/threonine-protein kinase pim-2-like n=1 Tax=Maylandia zebra TaxID=106582 RepID=UPI000D30B266|nr:serine/threonine-protein kinase pim-2-like [Maylandia zebra]
MTTPADKKDSGDQGEFQARYVEEHQLGEGGCGAVFSGYRIEDRFPVAIKHIPKIKSTAKWRDLSPLWTCKIQAENGRTLTEDTAKVILKQLVDAVKELEEKHIFHRDIKGQNILIETGSDVPRVRIIDFGLSCFVKQRSLYRIFYGTPLHIPPEWYIRSCYRCGPTTVWQMGVVLYEALHARYFSTARFLTKQLSIKSVCPQPSQEGDLSLNGLPEVSSIDLAPGEFFLVFIESLGWVRSSIKTVFI